MFNFIKEKIEKKVDEKVITPAKESLMDLVKEGFKFCAIIGTTLIIHNIVKSVTPEDTGFAKKATILVGEYVISDVICNTISIGAEKTWDDTAEAFNTFRNR